MDIEVARVLRRLHEVSQSDLSLPYWSDFPWVFCLKAEITSLATKLPINTEDQMLCQKSHCAGLTLFFFLVHLSFCRSLDPEYETCVKLFQRHRKVGFFPFFQGCSAQCLISVSVFSVSVRVLPHSTASCDPINTRSNTKHRAAIRPQLPFGRIHVTNLQANLNLNK